MADLKERIYEVLGGGQLASLATVTEDGKPWVRYVMTVTREDMVIRFATFITSRKVGQIAKNPEVHLTCGVPDLQTMKPYLQVQGRAELKTDEKERHGFWNAILADIFKGPDDPNYGVMVIEPYRIEYWMPGKFEPEVWTAQ
jgi:general stress protein 26